MIHFFYFRTYSRIPHYIWSLCCFIYSIIYLYQYSIMNILFYELYSIPILFIFKFSHWEIFHIVPITFGRAPIFFWVLPYFLKPQNFQVNFVFFLPQLWNQSFLQGALILITGYWYLETKIWVLCVLIAPGISLLLCHLSEQARKYMYVTSICTHTDTHIYLCIYACIYLNVYIFKSPVFNSIYDSNTVLPESSF